MFGSVHRGYGLILLAMVWLGVGVERVRAAQAESGVEWFETKVRPVLAERCYQCHSASSPKLKGALRLDTVDGILKGGDSGEPAVVGGKPGDSLLLSAIKYELDDLKMPPKKKLEAQQIADIEAWVKMGAPLPKVTTVATTAPVPGSGHPVRMTLAEGRKFWSFVKPTEPKIPTPQPANWARNDIDRFVLAKLDEKGLKPAPEADRRTLIRRATYDLTGLPPTAEEVDAFIADASPDAYDKLVDRLLASPRYGERWGRHWLDVARYADTKGYVFNEERQYAFAYTYRDWVIQALNQDLPYDQFLTEQIAADRLDLKGDKQPLAALGFLTVGRRFINNQTEIIDDRIDVVCRGTMALTVGCARCHDHKYDPIPTADYYSLYGVFESSDEPGELPLLGTAAPDPTQAAAYEKEHAKRVADVLAFRTKHYRDAEATLRKGDVVAQYLLATRELGDGDWPKAIGIATEKKLNAWTLAKWRDYLKQAAAKHDPVWAAWALGPATRPASQPVVGGNPVIAAAITKGSLKDLAGLAGVYGSVLAKFDGDKPLADANEEAIRLTLRGAGTPTDFPLEKVGEFFNGQDVNDLRELDKKVDELTATHPGSPPRAMAMEDRATPIEPHIFKRGNPANAGDQVPRRFLEILSRDDRKPFKTGSGRLELAQDIVSKENPLTARVMVNRVWQWHFGQGLVRTASDFGSRGDRPTHPELLDYLALRFENEQGWSLKKLHRLIMLSATYRQASFGADPKGPAVDPENLLLYRFNPQRLDFESLRDSLLAVSGQIDLKMGGRSVDILAEPFIPRRTVYAFIDRQNLPGVFRTFDFASPDGHQAARAMTSVPQQALFMMNSQFVIEQAKKLAGQSSIAAENDPRKKIDLLYRAVLDRLPTTGEVAMGTQYISTEQSQQKEEPITKVTQWQYGYGEYNEATGRLKTFHAMPYFTGSAWQGGDALPDAKLGWAMLNSTGGHVGNDAAHAVVRRFTAPRDCIVAIEGMLSHAQMEGDGVRGRLITSRDGTLGTWVVHNRQAETKISPIALKKGDTIDFVVDCGAAGNYGFDQFSWAVDVNKVPTPGAVAGEDNGTAWSSAAEFAGPAAKPALPLNAWEKYAQVLLESNEFMFVD
jgi:hypothetical protein